jgi:glycosyltransferase involved in cell wall biosynthesis
MILQVNFAFDRRLLDAEALLARYTTLTGWSEALLDAGADGVMVVQRFHHDLTVTRNGVVYLFRRGSSFAALSSIRASLAHVNGLNFPLRTGLLRAWVPSGTAIVVQDHGSAAPGRRHAARRLLMRAVDAFLFTSCEQADPWRTARLIGDRQPVFAVPEGSTRMRPIARDRAREISGVTGEPGLLWVGRLNANKDPLTVLDGFAAALSPLPGAQLTMVFGEDDLLPAVRERLASSPELTRRVRLVGRIPHDRIAAYFSAADLFVLGSHHEGSGYALIEACACGAAPVVTRIPSFREMTGDGTIGRLWTPGDAADCARAIVEAASVDRDEARTASQSHFDRCLSWRAVGARALSIYQEVVRRRRSD